MTQPAKGQEPSMEESPRDAIGIMGLFSLVGKNPRQPPRGPAHTLFPVQRTGGPRSGGASGRYRGAPCRAPPFSPSPTAAASSKSVPRGDEGALLIPADLVRQWEKQIATPYSELSDGKKKVIASKCGSTCRSFLMPFARSGNDRAQERR
jgi:hypothetical protein